MKSGGRWCSSRFAPACAWAFSIAQKVALKESDDSDALRAIQAKEIDEALHASTAGWKHR
jgi:hypothetical protein